MEAAPGSLTNVIFNPLVGGAQSDYTIKDQSPAKNRRAPCGTTVVTVYAANQHP